MAQVITHHGHRFGLDTAEWGSNSASGEKAGTYLVEWLRSLDADQTARLHAALAAEQADEAAPEQMTLVAEARKMGNRAALRVMEEEAWAAMPDTGHNCDLFAA